MTTNKVQCGQGKCPFTDEFCASGDCPYDTENVAQRNSQDLTEQWKKGELEQAKYWVKYRNGNIDIWELSEGIPIESRPEITEVLAPILSFEQWQELKSHDDKARYEVKHCGKIKKS